MYVPNYVPEQLEVPGNITLAPYMARVRFIRRVTFLHLASLSVVAALCVIGLPSLGLSTSIATLFAALLLLDVLRIRLRGKPLEATLSSATLPVLLPIVALVGCDLVRMHVPLWAVVAGPIFSSIYTLFCGRDYSFVGCCLLSLIGSSVVIAATASQLKLSPSEAATALLINTTYLVYFSYDLASLMARRRESETLAAVVDLYRDVLNFFGYFVRVIGHWKKHKIWVTPR